MTIFNFNGFQCMFKERRILFHFHKKILSIYVTTPEYTKRQLRRFHTSIENEKGNQICLIWRQLLSIRVCVWACACLYHSKVTYNTTPTHINSHTHTHINTLILADFRLALVNKASRQFLMISHCWLSLFYSFSFPFPALRCFSVSSPRLSSWTGPLLWRAMWTPPSSGATWSRRYPAVLLHPSFRLTKSLVCRLSALPRCISSCPLPWHWLTAMWLSVCVCFKDSSR